MQVASIDQPAPPEPAGRRPLTIDVNGQQYLWRYDYPGDATSYYEMVVPTNTTVVLKITSSDVIHSWWIPKLGGKADAVPGPHQRDLVQDRQGGHLQGPVRRALRRGPRRHARPCPRRQPPSEYKAFIERQKRDLERRRARPRRSSASSVKPRPTTAEDNVQ